MFSNFKVPAHLMPSDPRFGVGPSLIPTEHVKALYESGKEILGNSHRRPAVKDLIKEIQSGLKDYFRLPAEYEVVIGNGGATFLFDMIGLGLVKQSSLHFATGEFSSKWASSHKKIPGLEVKTHAVEYGQGVNPAYEQGHDMICATLNETSTGVVFRKLPDVRDKDVIVAIDGTSGAGQVPIDLTLCDVFFFSPQKVFSSEGGLWVAIMSPKAIKRSEEVAKIGRYIPEIMNWSLAIDNSRKNQTYNTPSVSTLFFLNRQIKLMLNLGYDEVVRRANEKAELIYSWAENKKYLAPYVEENDFRSNAVATIDVDDAYPVKDLLKVLREQKAVYDIEAYRKLGRNQLRISLFHNISFEDLKKLTQIISLAIESV